jgi:membrane protease YdiL (CAAX protease family)
MGLLKYDFTDRRSVNYYNKELRTWINEEVALRLFLFTILYFFASKCIKKQRTNVLWSVNICVALLFGAGHLPAAFKLTSPSTFEIARILFLNGIGGVVFGWLYWSRGLWAAIIAHFVADLVLHVLLR